MTPPSPEVEWPVQSAPAKLGAAEVHLWHLRLIIPAGQADAWSARLAPDERQRAERFAFPHLRERFVAAHAQLRRLLGAYLDLAPERLEFEITERGKPSLPGCPLHFNLSHTNDHALVAVTRAGEIGVDLECLDRAVDRSGIARRFFSAAEAAELGALPEAQQIEGFFNLWTRKEAWLKCTGQGISDGLNRVEFNCRPGQPARLLRIDGDERKAEGWWIESFQAPGRSVGAVAIRLPAVRLQRFAFEAR
jgi:4'-phosphopantetheinyl transferase